MGPRLISRGNAQPRSRGETDPHAFNGAATDQSRKYSCSSSVHVTHSAFNGAATDQSRKSRMDTKNKKQDVPSMGPRLISRGNMRMDDVVCGASKRLQWGRD